MKKNFLFSLLALLLGCAMLSMTSCLTILEFNAPASVNAGQTFTVSAVVKNIHEVDGSFSVFFYLSNDRFLSNNDLYLSEAYFDVPSMVKKDVHATLTMPQNLISGEYYLLASTMDLYDDWGWWQSYAGSQPRTVYKKIIVNNGVNWSGRELEISGLFPVVTGSNYWKYCEQRLIVFPSETSSWTCTVVNRGASPVNNCKVRYYLSADDQWSPTDVPVGEGSTGYLSSYGGSVETKIPVTIPADAGSSSVFYRYLLAVADPDNEIPGEFNENNNVLPVRVNVMRPTADLTVTRAGVPVIAVGGGNIPVDYEISNKGFPYRDCQGNTRSLAANAGPFVVKVWLSKDQTWDLSDHLLSEFSHSGLSASGATGISGTLPMPSYITSGTYYLIFQADANGQVTEASESNNEMTARFYLLNLNNLQPDCLELEDALLGSDLGLSEERADAPANSSATEKTNDLPETGVDIDLNIFPNPASDFVQFDLNLEISSDLELQVLDASGKVLKEMSLPWLAPGHYAERIDLHEISAGVYFVNVRLVGQSIVKKIFVQR